MERCRAVLDGARDLEVVGRTLDVTFAQGPRPVVDHLHGLGVSAPWDLVLGDITAAVTAAAAEQRRRGESEGGDHR